MTDRRQLAKLMDRNQHKQRRRLRMATSAVFRMRHLVLPVLLMLLGCQTGPGIEYHSAEYDLGRNDVLLVVPFSDPAMPRFQSKTGRELADVIVETLSMSAPKIKAISGGDFRGSVRNKDYSARSRADIEANSHPLGRLALEVGANLILDGKIIQLEDHPPKSPNIMRSSMTVAYALRSAEKWQPPLHAWKETFVFPEDPNRYISSQDMTPKEMLAQIVMLTGRRIAEKFYGHEEYKEGLY